MTVVRHGYLARLAPVKMVGHHWRDSSYRDWWLVKYRNDRDKTGFVDLRRIMLPADYVGKRIRFKVDVLE